MKKTLKLFPSYFSVNMKECEDYNLTTAVENSDEEVPKKRQAKRKHKNDYVYDSDLISNGISERH